jgi:hypothetical protein
MRVFFVAVAVVAVLFLSGCQSAFVGQGKQEAQQEAQGIVVQPIGVKFSVEQVFQILTYNFPHLRNGQTLFVTAGEYFTYPADVYVSFFNQVRHLSLPLPTFKAVLVVLGELHQRLNQLVAAGIAMGGPYSPPWFVIFIDNLGQIWGFDPHQRVPGIWKILPTDVNFVLF